MTTTTSRRKWWILAVTCSSLAMIFLDQSALPIALPSIRREMGLSPGALQWVINAYLLAMAVLIVLGGKLGDMWGHRRMFLAGINLFIASSILCAIAPDGAWLVMGRALQGAGASLMMPASSPLFRTVVGANEFGKMVGLNVSIASIFLILGPSLGGFLTAYLSWRWIFWINFPVALAAIVITIFIIPHDIKRPIAKKLFDWQGFMALTISLICLVVALMQGQSWGWDSWAVMSSLGISLVFFMLFIQVERRHPAPFVDLQVFKNVAISRGTLTLALIQAAYMGIIFWVMFLQYTLALSPQQTGIYLLAAQAPVLFSSPYAGRMLDRYGPRLPVSIGTAMITASSLWLAIFAWQYNFVWLCPAFIIFGIGSPLVTIGIMSATVSAVPQEKRGLVSGMTSAARQVGGSIGLALLTALAINVTAYATAHCLSRLSGPLAQLRESQVEGLLLGVPLPAGLHLSAEQAATVHAIAVRSSTFGFSCTMLFVTFISFAAFCVARKLPNVPTKY